MATEDNTSAQPPETDAKAPIDISTCSIATSLVDDLSNFLAETRGIYDLFVAAGNDHGFDIDHDTIRFVAQAQYDKANDLKKRLDGGAS